jgi:regulator of sigma E protease
LTELFATFFSLDNIIITTILPFLLVLTIVVFVHEMGHYLVGRWCGIGVREFSIGFGPELFGFNDKHGTRWKLSAIPLGGYVKFLGDMAVTSDPGAQDTAILTPEEKKAAFHLQPVWKRAATVVAGPMFNFLLTIAVFAVMFSIYGRWVSEPTVAEVRPDTPAAVAGFMPGDRFVTVNGTHVTTFGDVQRLVSGRAGDAIVFVMARGEEQVTLTATPEIVEQTDALGNTVRVGVIGVVNNQEFGQPRQLTYTPIEALGEAVTETWHVIARTGQFLQRFAVGREDRCQLGGPVKIADMAGKAAAMGIEWVVQLVALLSVGIGFLNLLPIPPLDGGHLAFYGAEAVLRRPVSERVMEGFYRIGLLLVMGFMLFVFWNDLFGC